MSRTRNLARLHSDSDGNVIMGGSLTVDTNTLHVDPTTDFVGIGTTTPDVNNFGAGSGILTVASDTGSAKTAMVNIVGDGNDTSGTRVASVFFNDASATGAGATLAGVEAYRASNHATDPGADLVFSTNSSTGGYSEHLRINAAGDIGFGTSTPNHYNEWRTLTFNGAGTSGGEIDFETNGTLNADIFANASNMHIRHLAGPNSPIKMYAGGNTAAKEALRLQDGRVMHPNMPHFATRPFYTNTELSGGAVVDMYDAHVNQGNHFNGTTNRFTAPAAGSYYFAFHSNIWKNTTGIMYFNFHKNGTDASPTQGGRFYGYYAGGWENMMGFVVLNLAQNDYVDLRAGGGSPKVDGGAYGQFYGYMLSTT